MYIYVVSALDFGGLLGPRHKLDKKCNIENEGRLMRQAIIKAILTNKLTVYLKLTLTVHKYNAKKAFNLLRCL